jgi:hypothetical protein
MTPYAYKTSDYGTTWTSLNLEESGVRGYAHVITEDNKSPNLLFVGTEFGLWISVDGGQHWAQYKGSDFPAVAVRDIVLQPRTSDLVLATHGRGIWIIDNISPLRQLTPELMATDATILEGPPSIQYFNANGGWPQGDAAFTGPSRPGDAQITYYQRARHMFGDLKLQVFDAKGTKLTEFTPKSKHKGLNRAPWSMRLPPPVVPPGAQALFPASVGPRVMPGTYPVKLVKGDKTYDGSITLVLDPRAKFNLEDRKADYDLSMKLYNMLGHMSYEVAAIQAVRNGASERAEKLPKGNPLKAKLETLSSKSDALRSKIVATKEGGAITGEERIREHVGELYGYVVQYEGRPTNYQVARADALNHDLEDVVTDFTKLTADLPAINNSLQKAKLQPITIPVEAEWMKEHANSGEAPVAASAMWERD